MERVYTIPLRNVKNVKRTIRAPRAINHAIWERGIQKIPSKITVKAVKDDDGIVTATLAE